MRNPADSMYIVMVKDRQTGKFRPYWYDMQPDQIAAGHSRKSEAWSTLKEAKSTYGAKNAYIQRYGPIERERRTRPPDSWQGLYW